MIKFFGMSEKWDSRPGTWDPRPPDDTRDLGPHKWYPGPKKILSGNRDPGPLKWDVKE